MGLPWGAALVHLFTASGIVCALLATRAVLSGAWELMFLWLGVALVIDGLDGTFARLARVGERLPRFSGDRLDLVIDYVTYVFVPALALLQAGFLLGWSGFVLASLILLSSLFHFSDTASKADDYSFVGFPAVWNIVAFYVFALALSPGWTAALVLACVALTFVPMRWAHPMRTRNLFFVTLGVGVIWVVAAAVALWRGLPAAPVTQAVLVLCAAYGVGLALTRGLVRPPA